jgi:hypothetical protein
LSNDCRRGTGYALNITGGAMMKALGFAVVAGVAIYYLLIAVDRIGIEDRRATATVMGKEHYPAGQSYVTQIVNNRPVVIPQSVPERFVLKLDIHGTPAEAAVPPAFYEKTVPQTKLEVSYKRGRVFGQLRDVITVAQD